MRRWRVRRAAHPHTRLKRHAPRGLIRATLHLVNREFEALADDFVTLGMLPRVGGLVCGRAGDAKPECRALGRRTYPTTHPPLPHSAWVAQDSEKLDVVPALTGVFAQALKDGVSNLSFGDLSGELGELPRHELWVRGSRPPHVC